MQNNEIQHESKPLAARAETLAATGSPMFSPTIELHAQMPVAGRFI
jgi:hypothetical protein